MAVHQVKEYYISMYNLSLTNEQKGQVIAELTARGCFDYEFQDNGTCLIVGGFEDQYEAEVVESEIREILH